MTAVTTTVSLPSGTAVATTYDGDDNRGKPVHVAYDPRRAHSETPPRDPDLFDPRRFTWVKHSW